MSGGRHADEAIAPDTGRPPRVPGGHFDVHLHLTKYWPDPPNTFYRRDLDYSVAGLLREMDAHGIGGGLVLEEEHAPSVEETLREGRETFEASGRRLLRSSTVDPTKGAEEIARAIRLWEADDGLAVIKLYPGYQRFYPHDPRLDPVYEFCERRGLILFLHQGDTLDPNGLVKYARPIEVDEVATAHRGLSFVLCHFGNPWIDEAAEVVYKNPNVYADTSGLFWMPRSPHYAAMQRRARDRIQMAIESTGDSSRVLYGSDWPLESLRDAVHLVGSLDLPERERREILGGNARRLLAQALRRN